VVRSCRYCGAPNRAQTTVCSSCGRFDPMTPAESDEFDSDADGLDRSESFDLMSSSSPASLTGRVILAVVLMIGFYVLALVVVAALVFLLYAMFVYGHLINPRITVFVVIAAAMVLWSITPAEITSLHRAQS